ncbi:hypothetical protein GR160_18565 [Flavobacterium sp. Sd200]|uniref:hypothetical protein n=1 Tax=Flavobacterium sp. Sd200 TaxID=2692211 RepID=UPI0013691818|nr:hypothetical protein [Flavobacterium sp. Sd200]MXN93237.1 hypothetical protein [Flavobacterium sp. Sd200]
MKRKFALFNLALMAIVQFAIAYQSFHAFSHTHYATEHTHTELKKQSKHTIAQDQVHDDESCSVCDFHFDFFVEPQQFCLKLDFDFFQIPYYYATTKSNAFFAGSLFALRAPPIV